MSLNNLEFRLARLNTIVPRYDSSIEICGVLSPAFGQGIAHAATSFVLSRAQQITTDEHTGTHESSQAVGLCPESTWLLIIPARRKTNYDAGGTRSKKSQCLGNTKSSICDSFWKTMTPSGEAGSQCRSSSILKRPSAPLGFP